MSKILRSCPPEKKELIEKLLANTILHEELAALRKDIDADDLSFIIQKIYDLNETYIFKLAALESMLEKLNAIKNAQRNQVFSKKIREGFRDLNDKSHIIVLAEGDSWFNYPIILTDIIDRINMDKDLAVYSIASGGDWLLNMLTGREYVEELSISHPDWFLISGGGNDLVGSRRLATILQPDGGSVEYQKNEWAQSLIDNAEKTQVPLQDDFFQGLEYLSKDFYALLMFFHLQYYFLLKGILKGGGDSAPKFDGIRIITQGYDYPLPSFNYRFGLNPVTWYIPFIRMFLGHGSWLKQPLQIRGINDGENQRKVMYAMIYLFNEMMIEMGSLFNALQIRPRVFHIDSRDSVGKNGWADELHPRPVHFIKTGETFINCIKQNKQPTYGNVYVVKNCHP
ncbi:MAG: hypothetical protein ACHQFX_01270 [Chitinophagales bacterium]